MELNYYLKIARLYTIPLKPPPSNLGKNDQERWYGKRALEEIFNLSGVAYLGIAEVLEVDAVQLGRQFNKRAPGTRKVEVMIKAIEARLNAVNALLNQDNQSNLTIVGLAGLGLLRSICADNFAEGIRRITVLGILAMKEPVALEIFNRNPHLFDGNAAISDALQAINLSNLSRRDFGRFK